MHFEQRLVNEAGSIKLSGYESKGYCAPVRNQHAFQHLLRSGLNTWHGILDQDSSQAGIFLLLLLLVSLFSRQLMIK